jgi:hypothetical protein
LISLRDADLSRLISSWRDPDYFRIADHQSTITPSLQRVSSVL